MDTLNAIKEASCRSGVPLTKVSRIMGRSRQYVHSLLFHKNIPTVDTLGMMLAACGYKLYAVGEDGDKICIDSFMDGSTYEEHIADIGYESDSE